MGIEIKVDPEEPRRPIKRPVNYMSSAVRLRLLTLFGLLVLVLIMMKEARKPERWEWMGFDKQPQLEAAAANQTNLSDEIEGSQLDSEIQTLPFDRTTPLQDLIERGETKGIPAGSEEFWNEAFGPLTTDGQRILIRFLRAVCDRTPIEEQQAAAFEKLVRTLQAKREQFNRRLAEQISYFPDDSPRKLQLNEELKKSKSHWEEKILPAWQRTLASEDITLAQQKANLSLLDAIMQLALEQVEDATAMNRAEEGSAWLLSWDRAMKLRPENATAVTHIQLVSQPRAFRGNPVRVRGWVRSAARLNVKKNELGINHYFVLWVRPEETNVAPYCVYVSGLPPGFPEIETEFVEMNERVDVEGVFFKIRSYISANNEVLTCPLILARTVQWNPASEAEKVETWFPPAWAVWSFCLLMPVIAAAIAWLAYLGTSSRRFVPGPKTQKKISENLVELNKNPDIQTDLEKVQALYYSEYGAAQDHSESSGQASSDG